MQNDVPCKFELDTQGSTSIHHNVISQHCSTELCCCRALDFDCSPGDNLTESWGIHEEKKIPASFVEVVPLLALLAISLSSNSAHQQKEQTKVDQDQKSSLVGLKLFLICECLEHTYWYLCKSRASSNFLNQSWQKLA